MTIKLRMDVNPVDVLHEVFHGLECTAPVSPRPRARKTVTCKEQDHLPFEHWCGACRAQSHVFRAMRALEGGAA